MNDETTPATDEQTPQPPKKRRYVRIVILLAAAVAAAAGGWWYLFGLPSMTMAPAPDAPAPETMPASDDAVVSEQAADKQAYQRQFLLLEMRQYLLQAQQQLDRQQLSAAEQTLTLAKERLDDETQPALTHLRQMLADDVARVQTYRADGELRLQNIDALLARQASTVSETVLSEPAEPPAFWKQPLEAIRARLEASLVVMSSKQPADIGALHAQTLLTQALILTRSAVLMNDEAFYEAALANAMIIAETLYDRDDETYQALSELATETTIDAPTLDAVLHYLDELLRGTSDV